MTWNYRLVKYFNKNSYGLHEVYYSDDGKEIGMTASPASFFTVDGGPGEIVSALQRALNDANSRPVFEAPESWCIPDITDEIDDEIT